MLTIRAIIDRHKTGERIGIASVCSAHSLVFEAALCFARDNRRTPVLIEATSNQVNQDGGYSGMVPADFRVFVEAIADRVGLPRDAIVLGGDHLGPNAWAALPAAQAMAKAETMVADYVRAGFRKIHLDCSMSCADDPVPLDEQTVAARAAGLCRAAEAAFDGAPDDAPVYVIGTEVPVPGGAAEDLEDLAVTRPEAALATIAMHRDLFAAGGLGDVWPRVIAVVVQPGVEFDHDKVVDYRPDQAAALSAAIVPVPHMVYEAHLTDYQTGAALCALVRDHFAILKVGPGVTFALREALWALDAIKAELFPPESRAQLRRVTLDTMHAQPEHWRKYYSANARDIDRQMQFSLSDLLGLCRRSWRRRNGCLPICVPFRQR